MALVKAKTGFEHYGRRRRGDLFEVSDVQAKELAQKGLAELLDESPAPRVTAGGDPPSSASPAVQASPQTTAKQSGGGGRRPRAASSS